MRRFIVALLLLVSLTACNLFTRINYGPYEVKYLYGGVDTVEAHYVVRRAGYLQFRNYIQQGGNSMVMQINADAVQSYRSLNPHGNKVGK